MLFAAAALALGGCGGGSSAPTTTVTETRSVNRTAPDLEALLPNTVAGRRLRKGSTTGLVVLGRTAFGAAFTKFLAAHGKRPDDLRFANAQPFSGNGPEIEIGVFQVRGVDGSALRRAIVDASRPNAPGLTAASATLGGRHVTKVVYPSGTALYLYPSGDRVFYVGTQDESLAGRIIASFP